MVHDPFTSFYVESPALHLQWIRFFQGGYRRSSLTRDKHRYKIEYKIESKKKNLYLNHRDGERLNASIISEVLEILCRWR